MSEIPGFTPVPQPGVDSADVWIAGDDVPVRPAVPQDWAGDGLAGVIGQATGPAEQGVVVNPPFQGPSAIWPSTGDPAGGTPAGQGVGPWAGDHARPGTELTADIVSDSVGASVAAAQAQQAAISGDMAEQGNAVGDQIDIPDPYTPLATPTTTPAGVPWME